MQVEKTKLEGVLQITLDPFRDNRGSYVELYNQQMYRENGVEIDFVEDDISSSSKNVLRGLHGDDRTWKLISCLHGEFVLAVVYANQDSPDFGSWETFTLSEKNCRQILVPPLYANGHVVLSEKAIFHYKQSEYYRGIENQFTYRWDEPRFGIAWPVADPVLSKRDDEVPYIDER